MHHFSVFPSKEDIARPCKILFYLSCILCRNVWVKREVTGNFILSGWFPFVFIDMLLTLWHQTLKERVEWSSLHRLKATIQLAECRLLGRIPTAAKTAPSLSPELAHCSRGPRGDRARGVTLRIVGRSWGEAQTSLAERSRQDRHCVSASRGECWLGALYKPVVRWRGRQSPTAAEWRVSEELSGHSVCLATSLAIYVCYWPLGI